MSIQTRPKSSWEAQYETLLRDHAALLVALAEMEQSLRERAGQLNVLTSDASYNLGLKDGLERAADRIEELVRQHRQGR